MCICHGALSQWCTDWWWSLVWCVKGSESSQQYPGTDMERERKWADEW